MYAIYSFRNNVDMPSINGIIYKKYAAYNRYIFVDMLLLLEKFRIFVAEQTKK